MKFNEKIIMLRKNKNLSQEDLGNELGVARQTISKWELGETTPEMDKLIKMSEIFEITLDDLIKDTEPNIDKNNANNTNTQKLAGLVIKILKGIGIFIIIVFAITVIMMIMGLVSYNNMKYDSKGVVEEIKENINSQIPLRRMGSAKEVAELVYFLGEDASSYITGQVINVDGGMI